MLALNRKNVKISDFKKNQREYAKMELLLHRQRAAAEARRALWKQRILRDSTNPIDSLNDEEVRRRYRFDRPAIFFIVHLVEHLIESPCGQAHGLPAVIQVLATLRFFAVGGFLQLNSDIHGISKSSLSRVIAKVCKALSSFIQRFIKFPATLAERQLTIDGFYRIANFPCVLGAKDGTHIPDIAPSGENEFTYVCRKGYHSINVLLACNSALEITYILAKYPGSAHDSFIVQSSVLWDKFTHRAFGDGVLVGDSGYPQKTWLMTPYLGPLNATEENYNLQHARTRCVIERVNGVLKSRFRRLDFTGGIMMYKPEKACLFITAAAILHNIAVRRNFPVDDYDEDGNGERVEDREDDYQHVQNATDDEIAARDRFARRLLTER